MAAIVSYSAEDLDGSTDRITDFRRDGDENDRIDLTQLDVLGGTIEEWLAANALNLNGSVTVDLGGCDSSLTAAGRQWPSLLRRNDGFMF